MKYKLTIAYHGAAYCGWQIQPNALSIQQVLEEAFMKILKEPVKVIGSGRTDAGVHAHGQVAHLETNSPLDIKKTLYSINGLIPHDIRVLSLSIAKDSFHARFSAKRKTYYYHLYLDTFQTPFKRGVSLHVKRKVDIALLKKACSILEGTHNFKALANESGKTFPTSHYIKTLYKINCIEEEDGVRLEFVGSGFLYKMVRNLTGLLLEVATRKMELEEIEPLLQTEDRKKAPKAAPAHGLFLASVEYN